MKKIVTFGEIMLRLAPSGFQRFTQARSFEAIYGGGEANVAVSLANYGEEEIPIAHPHLHHLVRITFGES
jgi:2-dehydro-3-deoxygluconokinase